MRIGLTYANWAAPADAAAYARRAEELGFESLWTTEHVVVPAGYESYYPYSRRGKMLRGQEDFDSPDPLVWLAFAGAATTSIKLATGVLILPQRNPVVLAKEVATLDLLSAGRVILGVGSGWLAEEFFALGESFEDRGPRTDEYIAVLRTLWTEERPSFSGRWVEFGDLYMRPLPVQRPVPIVIGGHSERAARRAGELGDGFFPNSIEAGRLPVLVASAREHAERSGRDPDALEISVGVRGTREHVAAAWAAGVHRVIVPSPLGADSLEGVAREVGLI